MSNKKAGSVITTIILLIICVALAAAVIIKMFQPKEELALGRGPQNEVSSSNNVYVKEVEGEIFTRTLKLYGTAKDDSDKLSIITRTSGYVSDILVSEDDEVEVDQIIGYIDPSVPGASYQKSPVKSRVKGKIESVDVSVGSYVSTGTVFATLNEDPKYIVNVNIPERYIDNVSLGSSAVLTSTIRSKLNTSASVTDIDNKIDSSTRTVALEITPDDDSYFLDGLALTVDFVLEREDGVFVLPTDSITAIGSKNYVYVVKDGVAEQREVVLGSSNDTDTVIVSGLNAGDLVVVEGSVSEGSSVNIVER